jgi:hypothetical protein
MGGNGCPVCCGLGRVLAIGIGGEPMPIRCPECAGLATTPASADDGLAKALASVGSDSAPVEEGLAAVT